MMARSVGALAVVVTIAASTASCTGTDPTDGTKKPTTGGAANVARFELAAEPLWRGDAGDLPEVMTAGWNSARFIDDALLFEQSTSTMAAVNPATGEPFWTADPELLVGSGPKYGDVTLQNSTGRAPVAHVGNESAMFLTYTASGAERTSWIAALRVKDASTLWKVPVPERDYDIVAADDRIVLLSLGARLEQPSARAISAADGAILWETPNLWPQLVAGDRVLGVVSSAPPDLDPDVSSVVGLNAATGQRVWSLEGRYQYSELGFVVGDVALIYVRPSSGVSAEQRAAILVDLADGAEIAQLGWTVHGGGVCAGDERQWIACGLEERTQRPQPDSTRLVTFDVPKRAKHTSPVNKMRDLSVTDVWGGYIFVRDSSGGDDVTRAVDQDGTAVSDHLPGALIGISDEHAAFSLPERGIAAVYQIKR